MELSKKEKFNLYWSCIMSGLSNLCAGLTMPVCNKWMMSDPAVTPRFISISELVCCITIIVSCKLWYPGSKVRKFVWEKRELFNIAYFITNTAMIVKTIIKPDALMMYLVNGVIFWCMLQVWFSRINSLVKAKLFDGPEVRNNYDTIKEMFSAIASGVGFTIGIFWTAPLKIALSIWEISVIINTIYKGVLFAKNRSELDIETEGEKNAKKPN